MFSRDLIIGFLCSVLLHAGLALGGEINVGWFTKKKHVKADETPMIQLEMPKFEPDPPETPEAAEAAADTTTIAPPSVADVPSAVSVNDFVQQVQPPPPPAGTIKMAAPKAQPVANKGMSQVFDLKNLDQQPEARFQVAPVTPPELKRQGITGEVLVIFICDSNGNVREARVKKSTNNLFDQAALDAINKWKFRPGKKGGKAVDCRMEQPFAFTIDE